jgi:hypothetical protein
VRALEDYLRLSSDQDLAREIGFYVLNKMVRVPFEQLSPAEQVIACLTELEMEVNNGGFHQYYWNSSGDHAQAAIGALVDLGAPNTAALLREANALLGPDGPSPDREARWEQLNALGERATELWFELDGRFYEYRENLQGLAASFIRTRTAEFTE